MWEEFCKDYQFNFKSKRSDTVDHSKSVAFYSLDEKFSFENREIPCRQLFDCIFAQSRLKVDHVNLTEWEEFKRYIQVPVTEGLSGQGKTRYAREFKDKIIEMFKYSNKGIDSTDDDDRLAFIDEIEGCLSIRIGKFFNVRSFANVIIYLYLFFVYVCSWR